MQALPREGADGGVATGVPQIVERLDRDVVVGVRKQRMAFVGKGEELRRAATATMLTANLALGNLADLPGGNEPVEVAANRRRRQTEARAQRAGALRPVVVQRPCDPIASAGVVRARSSYCGRGRLGHHRGFHNSNVTYFRSPMHTPLRAGDIEAWAVPGLGRTRQPYDRSR